MNRLLVLDEGHIVEQGTHDELLRLGGRYAALWRRQSGGFL
jgi:ABC-type multidrug transport system fused ATPase/permease subunit